MLKLSALVRLLKPCSFRRGSGLTTASVLVAGGGRSAAYAARGGAQRWNGEGHSMRQTVRDLKIRARRGFPCAHECYTRAQHVTARTGERLDERIALSPPKGLRAFACAGHAGARSRDNAALAGSLPPQALSRQDDHHAAGRSRQH